MEKFAYLQEYIQKGSKRGGTTLSQIVFEALRVAILAGQIPVGERINEKVYADQLNISRTPIRDALRRLEDEDLVEYIPRVGVTVKKFTVKDVQEIFQLRQALDYLATISAAQNMTNEQFDDMEANFKSSELAYDQADDEALNRLFGEFNNYIYSYADMPRLYGIVKRLREYLDRFRRISLEGDQRRRKALDEHWLIYRYMRARDFDKIKVIVTNHLMEAEYHIAQVISQDLEISLDQPSQLVMGQLLVYNQQATENNQQICDQENLVKDLSNLALESVLEEASLTPKPGLVDALDAGAHDDMDLTTFIRSSLSLQAYFEAAAQLGYADKSAKAIFNSLRQLGIEAEQSMFAATQGVNTHKGVIFNMGVFLTASTACLRDYGQANLSSQAFLAKVYAYLRQMLAGLITNDWQDLASKEKLTHGERVYLEHGIAGIRREAELGYPTVQAGFYQYQLFKKSHPKTAKIRCLIYLMAYVEDTNVIKRGGMMGYNWLQVSCRNLTAANLDDQAFLDQVNHLNKTCKRRWISPGGAADLLSVVLYLDKFTDFLA